MASQLTGRKVHQFRCHIDPCIGPSPKNAFSIYQTSEMEKQKCPWIECELTPAGVYVKVLKTGSEHLVPFANVQAIKLVPEEKEESKKEK